MNRAEPCNASKPEIERVAESIAKKLGHKPGEDLAPVVKHLGGQIGYKDFWAEANAQSGSVEIRGKDDFTIYLATDTTPERDRFTVAHELGHYILHYLLKIRQGKPIGPVCAERFASDPAEWEA